MKLKFTVARRDKTRPRNQKHFPESKNTSQNPKTLARIQNTSQNSKRLPRIQICFGFWEVFWILGCVFGFWDVLWILRSVFGFCDVFWILGSVLDSGTCVWILGSVLDSGKRFVPMSHSKSYLTQLTARSTDGVSSQYFGPSTVSLVCITSMCSVQRFPGGHSLRLAFGSFFYPQPSPLTRMIKLITRLTRIIRLWKRPFLL